MSSPATPRPSEAGFSSAPAPQRAGQAHIGKSVVVKGEIYSSEDLYVDGEVRGAIELKDHSLTVGPNGKVDANVSAREIIVQGSLNGNLHAAEKIEIRKTGSLLGDLATARIIIEDGAYFKGSIDILKPGLKTEAAKPATNAGAKPQGPSASTPPHQAQPAMHMAAGSGDNTRKT